MAALVADCVRLSDCDARVTCSSSATATKIRSCSRVTASPSHEGPDQQQAEAGNEDECTGAEQQRTQALGVKLADVCLQSHRGKRHREQESGRNYDDIMRLRRNGNEAVDED